MTMTAKEYLALLDKGKVEEARRKLKSAKDLIWGDNPRLPVDTPGGLLQRVAATRANNDYQRTELLVRLNSSRAEDVSKLANQVHTEPSALDLVRARDKK